jgi:hypothetical protein
MQIGCGPALQRPESRLQLMWISQDVCRLLAINLGRKSRCLQVATVRYPSQQEVRPAQALSQGHTARDKQLRRVLRAAKG